MVTLRLGDTTTTVSSSELSGFVASSGSNGYPAWSDTQTWRQGCGQHPGRAGVSLEVAHNEMVPRCTGAHKGDGAGGGGYWGAEGTPGVGWHRGAIAVAALGCQLRAL